MNGVIFQAYHWYTPIGGIHWDALSARTGNLVAHGFTALWLPPPSKAMRRIDYTGPPDSVGYDPYDFWDLGEFDQQGSVPTKYGTGDQLRGLGAACRPSDTSAGLQIYVDAVFNHMSGADEHETVQAKIVDSNNRLRPVSDWMEIDAYTRFLFHNRLSTPHGRARSTRTWNADDFDAVDYDHRSRRAKTIFLLKDKAFDSHVSKKFENYDYLMCADLDMDKESVRDELVAWGRWILEEIPARGFRLDAVKNIHSPFFREFMERVGAGRDPPFAVAEYWSTHSTRPLHNFIAHTAGSVHLFDVPLQRKFHEISKAWPRNSYDLRALVHSTLSAENPCRAVTFVENHDTQRDQSLLQPVDDWFKPWAYAFILLREQGYPCVFLADYDGADYSTHVTHVHMPSHRWVIDRLLAVRRHNAHGPQCDYFDHRNTVGWTRVGDGGLACLISNGTDGYKWMSTRKANTEWYDVLGHRAERIWTNSDGWACFTVKGESCSVWVPVSSRAAIDGMVNAS